MSQLGTGLFGGGGPARPWRALAIGGAVAFLAGCKHVGTGRARVKEASALTLPQLLSAPHTTQYDIRSEGGSAQIVALDVGGTPSLADLNADLAGMLESRLAARESLAKISESVDNGAMARGLQLGLQTMAPRVDTTGDRQQFWHTSAARQDIAPSLQRFLAVRSADGSPSQVNEGELEELKGKLITYAAAAGGNGPDVTTGTITSFFSQVRSTKVPRAAYEDLIPHLVNVVDAKHLSLALGDDKSALTARVLVNMLASLRLTAAASATGISPDEKAAFIERLRTMLGATYADVKRIVEAEQYTINVRVSRADLRSRQSTQIEDYVITQNKLAPTNQTAPAEFSYIARTLPRGTDVSAAGTLARFYTTPLPSLLSSGTTLASFSSEDNEIKDAATAAKKISRLIELMDLFGPEYKPIVDYLTLAQQSVAESQARLGIATMDIRREPLSSDHDMSDAEDARASSAGTTATAPPADSPERSGDDAPSSSTNTNRDLRRGSEAAKR